MAKRLEELFAWSNEVVVVDRHGKPLKTIYIRLAGDDDFQTAQKYALAASRKARKAFRDESSIEYEAMFADVESRPLDDLIYGILVGDGVEIRDEAQAELEPVTPIVLPDNPTLEDREKYEAEIEQQEGERLRRLSELIHQKMTERGDELKKLPREQLIERLKTATINNSCMEIYGNMFRDYCVYMNTFSDKAMKEREFSSFDAFKSAPLFIKTQLSDAYMQLDLSADDLKN